MIQPYHPLAFAMVKADIVGFLQAEIPLVVNNVGLDVFRRPEQIEIRTGFAEAQFLDTIAVFAVVRAVVHDDELKRFSVSLGEDGFNGFFKEISFVECRYENAKFHLNFSLWFPYNFDCFQKFLLSLLPLNPALGVHALNAPKGRSP